MPQPARDDVRVSYAGDRRGLAAPTVRRIVAAVLNSEGRSADVAVTFMSAARMRSFNRSTFNKDRATDVISFGMEHGTRLVADVYVCPSVARRHARRYGIGAREELVRLVVHGMLHALGYDHPEGGGRVRSPMWMRQERYVTAFLESSS